MKAYISLYRVYLLRSW